MRGRIVKGIAGFYYVKADDRIYTCKARGVFKKRGQSLYVGDRVEISLREDGDGLIEEIFERKNSFARPPVSNVDLFFIVCAAAGPDPSPGLLDRFTVMAEQHHTDIVIVINKCDLAENDKKAADNIAMLKECYSGVYPIIMC